MPDSVTSVGGGGRYTYDENGAGLCEAQSAEPEDDDADQRVECALKAGKAAVVCTGAGVAIVSAAPTLVGGVVAAFLTGAACGLEVAEAYLCYDED